MTFDEQIKKYKDLSYEAYGLYAIYDNKDIYELLEELKQVYAPTVEMTKEQHDYILPLIKEGKELGATFTEFWEVYEFTEPLKTFDMKFNNQEQAMQVWLHPETIKVVD